MEETVTTSIIIIVIIAKSSRILPRGHAIAMGRTVFRLINPASWFKKHTFPEDCEQQHAADENAS